LWAIWQFRSLDLSSFWSPLGRIDIVLLRNVLIYFSLEARGQVLARVREMIRRDGCLFLGAAETTLNLDDGYERIPFQKSFYYQPKV
jgi:chemotaxis protein methyltransferase CheR